MAQRPAAFKNKPHNEKVEIILDDILSKLDEIVKALNKIAEKK